MNTRTTQTTSGSADHAGLIDWADVHTGGMPAFERALRALEAGYLELADRLAAAQAAPLTVDPADAAGRIHVIDLLADRPYAALLTQALSGEGA